MIFVMFLVVAGIAVLNVSVDTDLRNIYSSIMLIQWMP